MPASTVLQIPTTISTGALTPTTVTIALPDITFTGSSALDLGSANAFWAELGHSDLQFEIGNVPNITASGPVLLDVVSYGRITGEVSLTYNTVAGTSILADPDPDTTPVPEPGTCALFGGALLAYGLYRRRRKAS